MTKLYYVGEFILKRRIASIPVIWTFKKKGKQMCYWPLRNVQKKVETMFHTLDIAVAKVNRIVDALTASENESIDTSGTVSGNESNQINVFLDDDNYTIDAVGGGHCDNIEVNNNTDGNGAVGGVQCDNIDVIGKNSGCQCDEIDVSDKKGDYQRDNIDVFGGNSAVGGRDENGAVGGSDENGAVGGGGENSAVGGGGENGAVGGGAENDAVGGGGEIDGAGLIDDNEIGENSHDEAAMEFVPWGDILPIGGKRGWKRSEHNLTDEQKMEDLMAFYRVIREKNAKAFITKLINDTFDRKWFCDNIGFNTYNNKIIFDKTELIGVWIDILQENFCKNWTEVQVRNLLLANFTRYRNTYNKSKFGNR